MQNIKRLVKRHAEETKTQTNSALSLIILIIIIPALLLIIRTANANLGMFSSILKCIVFYTFTDRSLSRDNLAA